MSGRYVRRPRVGEVICHPASGQPAAVLEVHEHGRRLVVDVRNHGREVLERADVGTWVRKAPGCPRCGAVPAFPGPVAWCSCSGWLDVGEAPARDYGGALLERAVLVLVVVAVAVFGGNLARSALDVDDRAPVPIVCEEDRPCWDCSTMGNRICGPPR